MTSSTIIGFINNTALLMTLGLLYDILVIRQSGQQSASDKIILGFILGMIGIGIMMNPWEFLPGVIFDTRSVLLCVTGFFFGTIPTLITVLITGGYRLFVGGTGAWTGFAVIATSAAVGLAWRHWRKKGLIEVTASELYALGFVTHVLMLLWMLTLPRSIALGVLSKISLPVILLFPLATVLLGKLMVNRHERLKSAKAVQESEEKYRLLIETQTDLVCRFSPDGRFVFVNDVYCKFFNMPKEELIGSKWQPLPVDDDVKDIEEKLSTLSSANPTVLIENRVLSGKGEIHWMQFVNKGFFDHDGNLVEIQSVGRDITDRKQMEEALYKSEEKFRVLYNNSPDMYVSVSPGDASILLCNETLLTKIGYSREEIIGFPIYKIYHEDCMVEVKKAFQQFVETGVIKGKELILKRKDGSKIDVSLNVNTVRDKAGKILYSISSWRDITEQKRMEARLRQSQKMEAVGTLAGGIAHDFNNILFPLIGYSEMLKDDIPSDSPLQNNIDEILHAAFRAQELVKQILAFGRQANQDMKPMKLQPVVKEALKLLRSSIPTTIDIQPDIDPGCGVVIADPTQVHQIVMNLATNAYHAMENTGGKLVVTLKQARLEPVQPFFQDLAPGEYARLTFSDTGIGIEKNILDRIFDPYFTTKKKGKGTGLGLSVVQGIVKSCKGGIRIYSEPGEGTEIHVYIPLIERMVDDIRSARSELIPGGTEKILLVDDEEAIVMMEQQMLERFGYRVSTRTGSVDALEAFRANSDSFDLVITDMTMPNMTGDVLAQKIIAIKPDISVIICTGFSERISQDKVEAIGVKGFLMKPVAKSEMAQMIRKVLDEPKG